MTAGETQQLPNCWLRQKQLPWSASPPNLIGPVSGWRKTLQASGYRIIPVNPNESSVLGEKCYARLEDIPEKIDIVDIFRRSELVAEVVDAAIRVRARAVWMQEGVQDEASAERARQAGLFVIMDLCIAVESITECR